jgi:flagellar hook-associated protein FlgK
MNAEYVIGLIVVGAVSFFFWLYQNQINKMDKVQIASEVMGSQIDGLKKDIHDNYIAIRELKRDHDAIISELVKSINELNVTLASIKGLINGITHERH